MKKLAAFVGTLISASVVVGCGVTGVNTPVMTAGSTYEVSPEAFRANGTSRREIVVSLDRRIYGKTTMPFKVKRNIPQLGVSVIEVPAGKTPEQVLRALRQHQGVRYVDYVNQVVLERNINDPEAPKQYALGVTNALKAWDITAGAKTTKIAIIDTGVDMTHPDIADNLVGTWNVFTKSPAVEDGHGHGTHCAGIAAAVADNNVGTAGIAPGCGLMAVQVLSKSGGGSDATIAEGVVWAADNGAKVMSMSLGLYRRSKVLEDALDYAQSKDVVIVASAGNNNAENDPEKAPHLPSTHPGVIEVAATDNKDAKARFSNFGKTVTVAAPGVDILSSVPGNKWRTMSGTSMAAPCAAGVVGLIRSKYPNLNREQVKKHLEATATDLGAPGFDPIYGHGRVDALKAVQ